MEDQLNKYIGFLKSQGYSVLDTLIDGKISIKYPANEENYNLFISFDNHFPYDFPKIFVEEKFKKRINMNGHVFKGNLLCLKLAGKEIINPSRPLEVIEYALEKAIIIIDKALMGNLNNERFEELKEYWTLSNKSDCELNAVSFYRSENTNEMISFSQFYLDKGTLYIHEEGQNYYGLGYIRKNLSKPMNEYTAFKCLFIKVKSTAEIFKLKFFPELKKYLTNLHNDEVEKYLREQTLGLITFIVEEDRNAQYSTLYIKLDEQNSEDDSLILKETISFNLIPRIYTQNNLFERSSDNKKGDSTGIKSICIVGCGSIGSFAADSFASIGVSNVTLIDFDVFEESNLLRHVCSISDIGKFKTNALEAYLLDNYPYLTVNVVTDSIFNCKSSMFFENQFDLVIVATGEQTSEFYCLNEFLLNKIAKRVALLWLEPYAISGHALIYDYNKWCKGDFDLLCSNIDHVSCIENKSAFYLKESGCSSTYMPYSGIDLKRFVLAFLNDIEKSDRLSFSYSKFLNISFAKRYKLMKINPRYYTCNDDEFLLGDIYD